MGKSKKKAKRHADGIGKSVSEPTSLSKPPSSSDHDQASESAATTIPISVGINIQTNASASFSWGTAFAAASTIRPNDNDLDEDFLRRTNASSTEGDDGGVGSVAQLAQGYKSQVQKVEVGMNNEDDGRGRDDDNGSSSASMASEDTPLEGRLISLSSDDNDQSLVLVDKQRGKVYSSGARKQNGRRLCIGKIVNGNIELDQDAIREMKQKEAEEQNSTYPSFPYPTNPDDHCETPLQSYRDILPVLDELSKKLGDGSKSKLRIYDPYYCNGSVVRHLESLGYTNVYNRKEDCYAIWKENKEPHFDVLLTNPPYSEDHIEKLMVYLSSSSFGTKPFLLLMPQWVHKKDYYTNVTSQRDNSQGKKRKRHNQNNVATSTCNPFYIVPKKRYVYLPPPDFRERKASDVHKKSSPFTSMWYVWGGTHDLNEALIEAFKKSDGKGCQLARSRSALRDLRRGGKKKAKTGK